MAIDSSRFAVALRSELGARSRSYARGRLHVESYGDPPVVLFAPDASRHGNFFDPAFAAIAACREWARRLDKVHTGRHSLPRSERKWRELDSSMSSDALLMNVFCTPDVAHSGRVTGLLGIEPDSPPVFGWKARVPYRNGRLDRTEVDMRWGGLLVEAKLTEADFQTAPPETVEWYRDFEDVFDPAMLPRVPVAIERQKQPAEFPEEYAQEEGYIAAEPLRPAPIAAPRRLAVQGYQSYQLIRNVLAAYAAGCGFCVLHDSRRPDLREAWFQVMAAVRSSEMRVRLKVLTWQELAATLPDDLQVFLDRKYGIVPPGHSASSIDEVEERV